MEEARIAHAQERSRQEIAQLIVQSLSAKFVAERQMEREAAEEQKKREIERAIQEQQAREREALMQAEQRREAQKREEERKLHEYRLREDEKEAKAKVYRAQREKEARERCLEEEAKRKERYEQTQALIEKMEHDRRLVASQKLKVLEDRERRRLEEKAQKEEAFRKAQAEANARRLLIVRRVAANQRRLLADMKRKAELREIKVQAILKEHEIERDERIAKFRRDEEEKLARQHDNRDEIERQRVSGNSKLVARDEAATKKMEDIRHGYEEKQRLAVEGNGEVQRRLQAKQDEYAASQEVKRRESDSRLAQRAQQIEATRQRMAAEREMDALQARLVMEKKTFIVTRQARRDEAKTRVLESLYQEKIDKIEGIEKFKRDSLLAHIKRRDEALQQMNDVKVKVAEGIKKNKAGNSTELRELAEMYQLDYAELEERARNPRGGRISIAEYIRMHGGQPALADDDVQTFPEAPSSTVEPPARPTSNAQTRQRAPPEDPERYAEVDVEAPDKFGAVDLEAQEDYADVDVEAPFEAGEFRDDLPADEDPDSVRTRGVADATLLEDDLNQGELTNEDFQYGQVERDVAIPEERERGDEKGDQPDSQKATSDEGEGYAASDDEDDEIGFAAEEMVGEPEEDRPDDERPPVRAWQQDPEDEEDFAEPERFDDDDEGY
jgi:hypothetical protein